MPRRIKDQSVVIVEDDTFVSQSLNDYFGVQNKVKIYATAEEAIADEASFRESDVFIIDYRLPGKNGVELFQHLRARFPGSKYILITGEMSYDLAEETRQLGFDALILKPFDFTILDDNIVSLLETPTT